VGKAYTTLSFTATKWMVFGEEGLFQDSGGTLTYSAQDPAKCSIEATVQAASLDTRAPGLDEVLRSNDFFDVDKFPKRFPFTAPASKRPERKPTTSRATSPSTA